MKPILSVIIPTYDRIRLLNLCLASLNKQTADKRSFEVIVVNDGSAESITYLLDKKWIFPLKSFDQTHKGPAAARNLGIVHANGEHIVFINDDTFPKEDFIISHLDLLKNQPTCASAGKVIWHNNSRNGKLEKALLDCGIGGWNHDNLHLKECDFRFFCTANIALPRKWLEKELFDESFKYATLEDTELGYRLCKNGLRIIFNKNAICEHLHHYELEDLIKRQENIGKSTFILINKHPELEGLFIKKHYKALLNICFLLKTLPMLERFFLESYFIALGTYYKYKSYSECLKKERANNLTKYKA